MINSFSVIDFPTAEPDWPSKWLLLVAEEAGSFAEEVSSLNKERTTRLGLSIPSLTLFLLAEPVAEGEDGGMLGDRKCMIGDPTGLPFSLA
jgi:hypothetical protein